MVIGLLFALSTVLPAHAADMLVGSHECVDHPHEYVQTVAALNTTFICQTSSKEDCDALRATEPASVPVAIAMTKAVALNRHFAPVWPAVFCPSSENAAGHLATAEAVLSPFLGLMQFWLASNPKQAEQNCRLNPVSRQQLQQMATRALRSPIPKTVAADLRSALQAVQTSHHVDDRLFADAVAQLAVTLSPVQQSSGAFRQLADGLGLMRSAESLERSGLMGLQMIARDRARGSETSSLSQCRKIHSLYASIDEDCHAQYERIDKLTLLVTSPLETQLYEMTRDPKLCTWVQNTAANR